MAHKKILTALICAIALLSLFASSRAWAREAFVYDPVLSLTGGTATTAEDEVPDPGAGHPLKSFDLPCGTATDRYGDIYVASPSEFGSGAGRIDIFNAHGEYLTEIADEYQPCSLAVDSKGNVYVDESETVSVAVFQPESFPPTIGSVFKSRTLVYDADENGNPQSMLCLRAESIAVDPTDDHLYIDHPCRIEEHGTLAEGSPVIDEEVIASPSGYSFSGLDVNGSTHELFVTAPAQTGSSAGDRVFVFDATDQHVVCELSGVPSEGGIEPFDFTPGAIAGTAADQGNGHFFVWETGESRVDEFAVEAGGCSFVSQLPQPPRLTRAFGADLAVDDPYPGQELGEDGYESPNAGNVYVTSGRTPPLSHLFAFRPRLTGPPEVTDQVAADISEDEASLSAELNPGGLDTRYHFEYLPQASYVANGESFAGSHSAVSAPVPDSDAGSGGAPRSVSVRISGLSAGVAYRFRLVAGNCGDPDSEPAACLTSGEGSPGGEGESAVFSTYPPPTPSGTCPGNQALRSMFSASLPDCRAYELVTPPETNGRIPTVDLPDGYGTEGFTTQLTTADGTGLAFGAEGGALPGLGGGGFTDTYEAVRGSSGWRSHFTGLSAAQTEEPAAGGIESGHQYSFWGAFGSRGSLAPGRLAPGREGAAGYLRGPNGEIEPIGLGSLGVEVQAEGRWISPGARHIVFEDDVHGARLQLEPDAPPTGTRAIYDRAPHGPTHTVSLLPGNVTPAAGEDAEYLGSSVDGSAIAFSISTGPAIYVRLDDDTTVEGATGDVRFAGLSEDGARLFYLAPNIAEPKVATTEIPQGRIYVCQVRSGPCSGPDKAQEAVEIGEGDESILVNISPDGSHVYFVSPEVIGDAEEEGAEEGAENLYVWNGRSTSLVAVLEVSDVLGERGVGLGMWMTNAAEPSAAAKIGVANDPSRTTPNGQSMVFQARAHLTDYDSDGRTEIYRYHEGEGVGCVSCNPTAVAATSDAQLQSPYGEDFQSLPPLSASTPVHSISTDGSSVFFESGDRLVSRDIDGKTDVYEWEAGGTGGCGQPAGCISLISSGRSAEANYLYAVTPDGHDVFFETGDSLLAQDRDSTPSIYDARVGGGFPEPPPMASGCVGEACQPSAAVPGLPVLSSSTFHGAGKPGSHNRPRCRKGRRLIHRHGRARCVKHSRHRKHRLHRRRSNHDRKSGRVRANRRER